NFPSPLALPILAKLWRFGSRCSAARCPGGLPLLDSAGADAAPIGTLKVALKNGQIGGVVPKKFGILMVPGPAVRTEEAIEAVTCDTGVLLLRFTEFGSNVYHQSR